MTEPVTIWTNPRCSKSRGAEALLAERGVPVERVLYLETPPPREDIERVLALLGTDDPRVLVRTGEPLYAELGLADADRDALLDALADHPSLLERPVVVRGDRAVVARPPERLLELLDDPTQPAGDGAGEGLAPDSSAARSMAARRRRCASP